MIHRLDIAKGNDIAEGLALKQLTLERPRRGDRCRGPRRAPRPPGLRRYTFTAAAVGFGLLILPLVPAWAARSTARGSGSASAVLVPAG